MESVKSSQQSGQRNQPKNQIDILLEVGCWLGIFGLIALISRDIWAADGARVSGFAPGSRRLNTLGTPSNAAAPSGAPGSTFPPAGPQGSSAGGPGMNALDDDDDFDDDDEEDFFPAAPLAGRPTISKPGETPPRIISAGGLSTSGPTPVLTDKGISVGGSPPNGVISKTPAPGFRIDSETAEGSRDIVTDFNFPDADILDIAKTLGKLTGKNFILDKEVKGKITIISNSPITVSDAWKAFLTALDMNGFALIPSGKYIRIARQRDARDKQLKTYVGEKSPDTDALITRVFPLKYISAEEVARTFRSFVPANARIIPYEGTNTVIVTDTGSNIAKLSKMLEILDVEGYDAGIEVIPVKYASAADLQKLVDGLLPGTSTGGPGSPPGGPRFGGGGGKFGARRTKEGGIINTIIADERTNTLIVHANSKGADQVRELVAKLDQNKPVSTGGGRVRVVYLQFAEAEQVANTLNNFSSQANTRTTTGTPGGGSGTGVNPIASSIFEGSIKISPDKSTNALVITASPSDFVTVKRVIDRLDIPRDQVYVETIIMEVAISHGFNFSTNVANFPYAGSLPNASALADLITGKAYTQNGLLLPFTSGGATSVTVGTQTFNVSSVTGLVSVLQSHSNGNILATPQIIALDNAEANFESAEKIPTLQTTNAVGVGSTQQINYQSVAVSVKIKPQINKITNFVKMDVEAKMGDISPREVPKNVADLAQATIERTAKTSVVVGDGDTIVLGGLTRDKSSDTVRKIPLLGDIPLLGWLFKSKQSESVKTNLLIFMTPHIVRQYEKVRAILDKKLKERDNFIETNSGGNDPNRDIRDDIIRSLPDLKELTGSKPITTFTIDDDKGGPISGSGTSTGSGPAAVPVAPASNELPRTDTFTLPGGGSGGGSGRNNEDDGGSGGH